VHIQQVADRCEQLKRDIEKTEEDINAKNTEIYKEKQKVGFQNTI
jgi:hypothetical protein